MAENEKHDHEKVAVAGAVLTLAPHERIRQRRWWFCCRCHRRMTKFPWAWLTMLASDLVRCPARVEASAASALIDSTKAAPPVEGRAS